MIPILVAVAVELWVLRSQSSMWKIWALWGERDEGKKNQMMDASKVRQEAGRCAFPVSLVDAAVYFPFLFVLSFPFSFSLFPLKGQCVAPEMNHPSLITSLDHINQTGDDSKGYRKDSFRALLPQSGSAGCHANHGGSLTDEFPIRLCQAVPVSAINWKQQQWCY